MLNFSYILAPLMLGLQELYGPSRDREDYAVNPHHDFYIPSRRFLLCS